MKIYHQAGHNTKWNLDSFQQEHVGDGIIFSPVHYSYDNVEAVPVATRKQSLFDPQFYVPGSQRTKLNSYPFFPEKILNGFSTSDYLTSAEGIAEECLKFQIDMKFEAGVIPARFFDQMISDFVVRQKTFSIDPFLEASNTLRFSKELYLSLPLTEAMIMDQGFRTKVLNMATVQGISGVYLMIDFNEPKQIGSFEKLWALCEFIRELQNADLKVIYGYANTEGLLFSVIDIAATTIGSFENTRRFSIDKFLESEDQRAPSPRLYFPKLLNWLKHDTVVELLQDHPSIWKSIYEPTLHSEEYLNKPKPAFNQPPAYKHHFTKITEQYRRISSLPIVARKNEIQEMVKEAICLYNDISKKGVVIADSHSRGEHLQSWNRFLNRL